MLGIRAPTLTNHGQPEVHREIPRSSDPELSRRAAPRLPDLPRVGPRVNAPTRGRVSTGPAAATGQLSGSRSAPARSPDHDPDSPREALANVVLPAREVAADHGQVE